MRGPVHEVFKAIADEVNQTPLVPAPGLSLIGSSSEYGPPMDLYLKCEGMQKTGSFKYRGAWFVLSQLSTETLAKGLVATSSGTFSSIIPIHTSRTNTDAVYVQAILEKP